MASKTMEELADYYKNLHFKKVLLNGLDEEDVWKKIEELQLEFQSVYEAQEERYKALLKEREEAIIKLRTKRE